jgi:hypothetical protein
MDRTVLVRWRWRLRGAWMWKAFVALIVVDAVIGSALPPLGDSQSVLGAALVGAVLGLAAIVLLSWPAMLVIRMFRKDLPKVVARDYGGTAALWAVTAGLLAAGIVHHGTLETDRAALQDATARAQAYVGDHAPAPFRANLQQVNVFEVQPPRFYRVCVFNRPDTRTYCVVVDRTKPFGQSVRFDGYEPNAVLDQGVN